MNVDNHKQTSGESWCMFRMLYICMVAQRLGIINRKLRKKGEKYGTENGR
jgi:hypothetical protein